MDPQKEWEGCSKMALSRARVHFVQNGSSKRMGGLLQNDPLSSPGPREGHFGAPLTHFWPKRSYRVMCLLFFYFFRYLSAKTPSFGSLFGGRPQHAYFGATLTHFWPKQRYLSAKTPSFESLLGPGPIFICLGARARAIPSQSLQRALLGPLKAPI